MALERLRARFGNENGEGEIGICFVAAIAIIAAIAPIHKAGATDEGYSPDEIGQCIEGYYAIEPDGVITEEDLNNLFAYESGGFHSKLDQPAEDDGVAGQDDEVDGIGEVGCRDDQGDLRLTTAGIALRNESVAEALEYLDEVGGVTGLVEIERDHITYMTD